MRKEMFHLKEIILLFILIFILIIVYDFAYFVIIFVVLQIIIIIIMPAIVLLLIRINICFSEIIIFRTRFLFLLSIFQSFIFYYGFLHISVSILKVSIIVIINDLLAVNLVILNGQLNVFVLNNYWKVIAVVLYINFIIVRNPIIIIFVFFVLDYLSISSSLILILFYSFFTSIIILYQHSFCYYLINFLSFFVTINATYKNHQLIIVIL
jgi:hypothetical protein